MTKQVPPFHNAAASTEQLDRLLAAPGDFSSLQRRVRKSAGIGDRAVLYKYIFSKKTPALPDTQFAVFGMGDSSYERFAKTGKDFDSRLAALGAQCLHDRVDADVEDYQVRR